MTKVTEGVIHGRTIELRDDSGFADGQVVRVVLQGQPRPEERDAALCRVAGSMANDPEFDAIMDQVRRDREQAAYRDEPGA